MSRFYVEKNDEGTRNLFEKRNYYNSQLSKTGYKNVVDFNFGEKFFYGRVSRDFIPILLSKTVKVKKFKKAVAKEHGLGALHFVVDAFNDMAQQFQRCATYGSIDPSDPFLTNIKIYRAYQNPNNFFEAHKKEYFGAIVKIFRTQDIKVRDFDDFIDKLMPILQKTLRRNPFTKTGFIKSKRCPILCSGLALEIADIDPSVDQRKIDQFVNSKNWEFYLNACASYGFMVDKRMPWRIVADIGDSPTRSPMLDYAERYGSANSIAILSNYYVDAHRIYRQQFRTDMLNLYNGVKLRNFLELDDCEGKVVSRRVTPTTYTVRSFFERYPENRFLKLYFNIRIFEEEINMTDNEKSLLVDDCIEIYQRNDYNSALDAFERIINEPFDKRGSLSYIKKYVDASSDINE
jgi:hypothetical protein